MGGPLKLGGAVNGGSPWGGGVLESTFHGLPNLGNVLGFLLEFAEKGFRPLLGPLPNLLLDSDGRWFFLASGFFCVRSASSL